MLLNISLYLWYFFEPLPLCFAFVQSMTKIKMPGGKKKNKKNIEVKMPNLVTPIRKLNRKKV